MDRIETSALDSQETEDEMRRAMIGLAVTALTALAAAWPASAALAQAAQVTQVTHVRFSGNFASAYWLTNSATSDVSTYIDVSQSTQGSQLFVNQNISHLDANGNYAGETDTFTDGVTSGFSFTFAPSLASASLSASGLPATTCTYDANGNEIGCSATIIDVNVSWTGQGPITHSVFNHHVKSAEFSETDHSTGTERDATPTGTVAGFTPSAAGLQFAGLEIAKSGTITVCTGSSC